LKIQLINKDDGVAFLDYESPISPCKNEVITIEIKGKITVAKVDQVEHFVRENRMARQNELNYVGVTVKPMVNAI